MKNLIQKESVLGKFTRAELDCGLSVLIVEKPEFTSSYAVFGTRYGSIDTCFSINGENFVSVPEGIAHFLEHKLFESKEQDAFERFSKTGAYCNAYTTFDRTCYLFSCSDLFYENLGILLDFVQSPYFTAETVSKEQGIIAQEIKMYEDSPGWRVLFNMLGAMFKSHPVKIDIAGTVDSISKIDEKLLYYCYNAFYNPSNMCVCIAGNVNAEQTLKQIEKSIKNNKPVRVTRKRDNEPAAVQMNYVEQKLCVAGPLFCFGYKESFDSEIRTQKEKAVAEIAIELICGDSSPLYKRLTEEGLINDEFSGEYFNGPDYSVVFFEGESNDPEKVAELINDEIRRLEKESIDSDLFEAIKKSAWGDRIRRFESLDGIVSDLIESAFYKDNILEGGNIINSITEKDIQTRLSGLTRENSVLSVINRKEN